MLKVVGLHARVGGREILQGVDLEVSDNEVHVLLGPNGAGKSTLLSAIMGLPWVEVTQGKIIFNGEDVTKLAPEERAKKGIAISYQFPPKISGLKLRELAASIAQRFGTNGELEELAKKLNLEYLLDRELNVGFSGGEMKRAELYLTLLQAPKIALLDEPDSGVDVENLQLIASGIQELVDRGSSVIVVTHTGIILKYLKRTDVAHVLVSGKIVCSGKPEEVVEKVLREGFEACRG